MYHFDLLSVWQYDLIYNVLSMSVAIFGAATLYFFLRIGELADSQKLAAIIAGLVTAIATYHYFRMHQNWGAAFSFTADGVERTEQPINLAYRYADWLATVPLLMIELVHSLNLKRDHMQSLATKLAVLAVVMIAAGYPGEVSDSADTAMIWWIVSMIPFLVIAYILAFQFTPLINEQPEAVRGSINKARWLTFGIWWWYPVVYLFPILGWQGPQMVTVVQVGYSLADIFAKAGLGLLIVHIALERTRMEKSG